MRLRLIHWSLPLMLTALSGCRGASCGQTGCLGTVELVLTAPLAKKGQYVVDVQVGAGDSVRCTVRLPKGSSSCDQRWADVLMGDKGQVDGVIVYRTDVASLGVSVARDGRVIGGGTYEPDYERWFPNGPTCDDEPCRHALVEVGMVEG
jgi:hypothetical protein